MREGSIVTCRWFRRMLRFSRMLTWASRRIFRMPHGAFVLKTQQAAVLAESLWHRGIESTSYCERPGFPVLLLQRGQDPLRSKRSLAQAHANRVVNGIGDGRNGRCQRAFAGFFGAEWRS